MNDQPAPYGNGPVTRPTRIRIPHLGQMKAQGRKWAMLTAYDTFSTSIFEEAGIPVMAHIGFTPQMEHQLGGYRVQGRGEDAQRLIDTARAFEAAGAFALLIERVPAEVGAAITQAVAIPTVGIGAGNQCDAQVLVWQDMAGLGNVRLPRFVKQYADVRSVLHRAASEFAREVGEGVFPGPEHTFQC
ncbi:3-methyl-2-oxobutanoate hydroxymethyltransferase [Pseudomonas aegrilactucae]|uniref:3-methyl-2-oxobutanoate hydroxymethyltransferase n=1 Tax=Pseudomonas aegrilactucae TaxID=2854028 RepID=A0A9Q3AF79_9PSED|nr:3-methyl-2-oxobutanoate hydroxymethyltransferase [Pseudomonas aegrilactucae]MBV6288768.1 3-methyl-2-oxobutanoate hydroxymethyltransferase [Pseudomonas aegrilactucae]